MKKDLNLETIVNIIIIVTGIGLIIYPWFGEMQPINLFHYLLGMFTGLKLVEFAAQKDKSDKENLYVAIASAIVPFLAIVKFPNNSMLLPLSILTWVSLLAIVKLIKIDYLHDRDLEFYKVKLYGFIFFIILGILTSYSLHFIKTGQTIIIGFFIIVMGLLDLFKDHVEVYLSKSIKKKTSKTKKNK